MFADIEFNVAKVAKQTKYCGVHRSNSDPHTLGRTSHLPVASEREDKPKSGNSPAAPLLVM